MPKYDPSRRRDYSIAARAEMRRAAEPQATAAFKKSEAQSVNETSGTRKFRQSEDAGYPGPITHTHVDGSGTK